jgi:hypothetical protein
MTIQIGIKENPRSPHGGLTYLAIRGAVQHFVIRIGYFLASRRLTTRRSDLTLKSVIEIRIDLMASSF